MHLKQKLLLRLRRQALPHAVFAAFAFGLLAGVHSLFLEHRLWVPGFLGASVAWVAFSARSSVNGSLSILVSLLTASGIGIACSHLNLPLPALVMMACSPSIFMTSLLGCEYPPAGAAAVITVSGNFEWWYLLSPVTTGALMVILLRYLWLRVEIADGR